MSGSTRARYASASSPGRGSNAFTLPEMTHPGGRLVVRVHAPRLDLQDHVQTRLDVLDRQPEHREVLAEHRGIGVEGNGEIDQVIVAPLAVLEQDDVVDDEGDRVGWHPPV